MAILEKHPIWDFVSGAESFESFQANVLKPIYLKTDVSKDIQENISIVQKLLLHSFYEYEFIDIALTHTVFTFEKAMKIKYKQLSTSVSKNIKFSMLINWFFQNDYFETTNKDIPHQLRHIRNGKTHDEVKSLGGLVFLAKVYDTIDLINDLYEDVSLRKLRKAELSKWNQSIQELVKNGAILSINNKRLIVHQAYAVFYNNKNTPSILNLSVSPIFDLKPYENGTHPKQKPVTLELTNFEIDNDVFSGKELRTGNSIELQQINDEINLNKFLTWKTQFQSLNDFSLILFINTEPLDKYFISSLRAFHRLG